MPGKKARRGRGEGEVEELDSGSWRATLNLGVDQKTKKRVRLRKTFPEKRKALEWLRDRQAEQSGGTLTATATTVGEWLTTWMEVRKPVVSANTYRTEADTAERRVRPGLGPVRLRDLNPLAVERWLARMAADGVTQNERRKAAILLRACLNAAVKRRVIGASPMRGVAIPKRIAEEPTALDRDQLATLLAAAEESGHGVLFRVWADTGLRPGELLGLKWEDFDRAKGTLSVRRSVDMTTGKLKEPKTKRSRRTLLLSPSAAATLAACRGDRVSADPVFGTASGKHWWQRNFSRDVFEKVVGAAKLSGCTPYTLRHTCASLLLQKNVNVKVVSERLGHEDILTTLRTYGHVLPGMQEAAAAAMEEILNPPTPR